MGSMNISIRREIYDQLQQRKLGHESFSDVIERLLKRPTRPSDFAGILSEEGAAELRANIARQRALWTEGSERRRRAR